MSRQEIKSPEGSAAEWEQVQTSIKPAISTSRLPVPGGWLYRVSHRVKEDQYNDNVVFVPHARQP
jgi:hypothetical protein